MYDSVKISNCTRAAFCFYKQRPAHYSLAMLQGTIHLCQVSATQVYDSLYGSGTYLNVHNFQ